MTPLWLSLRLGLVTTVLLLAASIPLAYVLTFKRWPFKPLVEATVALPIVLPPTVIGFYMLSLLARNGPIGHLLYQMARIDLPFTFAGLVVASVVYSLPFAVQPLQAAFEGIDRELLDVARTFGAGDFSLLFRVVLPNAVHGVVSAAVLAFAHTLGEFGVVMMVGGNIPGRTQTASIAVYDRVSALDYSGANSLSLALLGLSYGGLFLLYAVNRGARRFL